MKRKNGYQQIYAIAVFSFVLVAGPPRELPASQPVLSAGFYPILPPVAGTTTIGGGTPDGALVAGMVTTGNERQMFLWDPISGSHIVPLPANHRLWQVADLSADGSTVVGQISDGPFGTRQAFLWTQAGGFEKLGTLSTDSFDRSSVSSVNSNGSVIVGTGDVPGGIGGSHAFRWTRATGMLDLGTLGTSNPIYAPWSAASRSSEDGSIIVGATTVSGQNQGQMARWTSSSGWENLGSLPDPPRNAGAAAMTPDGSIIVGSNQGSGFDAIIWSQAEGMRALPRLDGYVSFGATQISANGNFIIGQVGDATTGQAIAYLKRDGGYTPELLTGLLTRQGLDLMGWKIWAVTSMSPDGRVLGGMAFDTNGARQGFVAVLPVPEGPTLELLLVGACGVMVFVSRIKLFGLRSAVRRGPLISFRENG